MPDRYPIPDPPLNNPWDPRIRKRDPDPFNPFKELTELCPSCRSQIRAMAGYKYCPHCGTLLKSSKDELEEIKNLLVIINAKIGAYLAEKKRYRESQIVK